jgi:hypothetical protein
LYQEANVLDGIGHPLLALGRRDEAARRGGSPCGSIRPSTVTDAQRVQGQLEPLGSTSDK